MIDLLRRGLVLVGVVFLGSTVYNIVDVKKSEATKGINEPRTSNSTIIVDSEDTIDDATQPSPSSSIPIQTSNVQYLRYEDYHSRFPIPDWMEDFLQSQPANDSQAHIEMLENPDNKFIVMTCYMYANEKVEDCGGFADRMGILPYYIQLAHNTSRRLLIKYYKPTRLEEYLVPPQDGFDWRLPEGYLMEEWYEHGNRTVNDYKADRRAIWHERLQQEKWQNKRAIFVNNNLARRIWEQQDTMIGVDVDAIWPGLFRRFFQPSKGLAKAMAPILEQYPDLIPGNYAAAHLRVRYPSGIGRYIKYIDANWWGADKGGGAINLTDFNTTINIAKLGDHAVECAVRLVPDVKYVYVASDAGEVIDYLIDNSTYWSDDSTNSPPRRWNGTAAEFFNSTNAAEHGWGVPPWEIPTTAKIIARTDYHEQAPHFDGMVLEKPEEGYPTFVDLWMLAHAKCHTTGVGGFGRFGSVLSGYRKECATRHRDMTYFAPSCPTPEERKVWKAAHPHINYDKLGDNYKKRRRLLRWLQHND